MGDGDVFGTGEALTLTLSASRPLICPTWVSEGTTLRWPWNMAIRLPIAGLDSQRDPETVIAWADVLVVGNGPTLAPWQMGESRSTQAPINGERDRDKGSSYRRHQ